MDLLRMDRIEAFSTGKNDCLPFCYMTSLCSVSNSPVFVHRRADIRSDEGYLCMYINDWD